MSVTIPYVSTGKLPGCSLCRGIGKPILAYPPILTCLRTLTRVQLWQAQPCSRNHTHMLALLIGVPCQTLQPCSCVFYRYPHYFRFNALNPSEVLASGKHYSLPQRPSPKGAAAAPSPKELTPIIRRINAARAAPVLNRKGYCLQSIYWEERLSKLGLFL